MNYKRILFFLILLTFSNVSVAMMRLNISIICRLGIDESLMLASEHHVIRDVFEVDDVIRVKMENGLVFYFTTKFVDQDQYYGPSATVGIIAQMLNKKNKKIDLIPEGMIKTTIGKSVVINFKDEEDRQIDITLVPVVK